MDSIKISTLTDPDSDEVIELLARAYLSNPINVAFRAACEIVLRSEWYAAFYENRTVGVVHMVKSPGCRLSPDQQDTIGLRLAELGSDVASRIAEWLGEWAKRDPDTDHYHLGPIAVLPEFQKRGIGKFMMQHFCERVDEAGIPAYLETDRRENVGFYEKSGFSVTEQAVILGVPNWFMTRPAHAAT
jgi:GNAT superfamily N-acetyltransferase